MSRRTVACGVRSSLLPARARPPLLTALFLMLAASGIGSPLHAQGGSRQVDSGRFRISSDGQNVGSEVFAIRREASSLQSVARLTTGLDTALVSDRIVETRLQTNDQLEPELFELQVQRGGDLSLVGVRSGSRFRLRTRATEGERWKEFLVPSGLVILPTGFVHFHHFLFRQRSEDERLTGLVPVEGVERRIRIVGQRPDTIRAEGVSRPATRWEVTVGDQRRLVWRDEDGRILRVEVPAENWVAVRTPGNGPAPGGPIGSAPGSPEAGPEGAAGDGQGRSAGPAGRTNEP